MAGTQSSPRRSSYRRLIVLNAVEFLIVSFHANGVMMWKFNTITKERTAIEVPLMDGANAELLSLVQPERASFRLIDDPEPLSDSSDKTMSGFS